MTGVEFQLDEADLKTLMQQFQRLGERTARKVSKAAVSAGATVVLRHARQEVPVHTGTLKASLGRRVKHYPASATAVAVIGARISGQKRGFHAHLVEDGHVNVDGSFTPGNPWLRRSVDAAEPQAVDRMHRKLIDGIEREAAR